MTSPLRLLALALILILAHAVPAAAEKRVALVIGNGAYTSEKLRLANPPRDATLISAALENLGFEVETIADANKEAMEDAIGRLAQRSRDADVSLFYYAGHAIQDLGKNFLMPVDGALKTEQDLRRRFVRLDDIIADLSTAKGARIVILDACRDNDAIGALRSAVPQTRSIGVSRGLAAVPKLSGMLVAFATQADRVAADGTGVNSPFAYSLAKRLVEPGVELRVALIRVRQDVALATQSTQVPEVSDSLLGELYLQSAELAPTPEKLAPTVDADPDIAECDRLAALPGDTQKAAGAIGVKFDKVNGAAAVSACTRAVERFPDVPRLAYQLGRGFNAKKDYAEALRWYEKAHEKGHVAAMIGTGGLYEYGEGVKRDYAEARRWYEKAAGTGNAVANYNIGKLYYYGQSVKLDYAEARRWYEKAAELGYADAMNDLGSLYHFGEGVKLDYAEARRWYEKAVELGSAGAMNNLGVIYANGRGVQKDVGRGCDLYRQAASLGNDKAKDNLRSDCTARPKG
jgi:uncharacterized caspase-like protein